jgi:hypothetical protein
MGTAGVSIVAVVRMLSPGGRRLSEEKVTVCPFKKGALALIILDREGRNVVRVTDQRADLL